MAGITMFQDSDAGELVQADQTIFREGDPEDAMFVVAEGELEVQVPGGGLERVGVGGVVGEMALIDGQPRSATVVADRAGSSASTRSGS